MFSMMIVDDEPLVRKGIATSIDWEAHGIEVVAEAGNGIEALQKLSNRKVDVVLADIRMPFMTGIELSQQIKEQYPEISIVLLSGYEDFAYAKAAIQIGVHNYLLKPANADKLVSVISEIRDKKRDEQLKRKKEMSRIHMLNENMPYLKYKFLSGILNKEWNRKEIEEKIRTLRIQLSGPKYQIVVLDIDDFLLFSEKLSQKENEAFRFAVFNIAEETLLSYYNGFVCYGELNQFIGLVSPTMIHSLLAVCEEIQLNMKRYLKLSVSIGIGSPYSNLSEIDQSYWEANQALKGKVYHGKGKIFMFSQERQPESVNGERLPLPLEEKSLIQCLKLMNVKELHQMIDQYFLRFVTENAQFEEVKHACVRLVILLIQAMEEIGFRPESVFGSSFIPHVSIERFEVAADLETWMRQKVDQILRHIEENRRSSYKRTVKDAIRYIEEHYEQAITLGEVSDHVNVTPAYFSKLFKEETGITFIKWLNQLRIEKAKGLLKNTRLKTYEISEKVGYYDYKYFSNTFRKYTGVSPREYRNR